MKEFKHGETVQVTSNGRDWYCRVYIGAYQDRHVVGSKGGGIYTYGDDEIRNAQT